MNSKIYSWPNNTLSQDFSKISKATSTNGRDRPRYLILVMVYMTVSCVNVLSYHKKNINSSISSTNNFYKTTHTLTTRIGCMCDHAHHHWCSLSWTILIAEYLC